MKLRRQRAWSKLGSLKLMLVEAKWKADLIYTKTMKRGTGKRASCGGQGWKHTQKVQVPPTKINE